jgi:hypothetical protein
MNAKQKAIVVEIGEDGSLKTEGHGFSGPDCQKAMAFLDALGKVTGSVKKKEWSEKAVNQQKVRQ